MSIGGISDLLIAEAGPAVVLRLSAKLLECAAAGCDEQRLSGDGVIEGDLPVLVNLNV